MHMLPSPPAKISPEKSPWLYDSMLVPALLVFMSTDGPVDLNNYSLWWRWQKGADWRHPEGPGSSIKEKEAYPPVRSFAPTGYDLFDMTGNAWEWCSDWYSADYYHSLQYGTAQNPQGPSKSFNLDEPLVPKRSLRGGSFLCNDSYCRGYRVSRRMKSSPDTGLEHAGFRCVRDVPSKS